MHARARGNGTLMRDCSGSATGSASGHFGLRRLCSVLFHGSDQQLVLTLRRRGDKQVISTGFCVTWTRDENNMWMTLGAAGRVGHRCSSALVCVTEEISWQLPTLAAAAGTHLPTPTPPTPLYRRVDGCPPRGH